MNILSSCNQKEKTEQIHSSEGIGVNSGKHNLKLWAKLSHLFEQHTHRSYICYVPLTLLNFSLLIICSVTKMVWLTTPNGNTQSFALHPATAIYVHLYMSTYTHNKMFNSKLISKYEWDEERWCTRKTLPDESLILEFSAPSHIFIHLVCCGKEIHSIWTHLMF